MKISQLILVLAIAASGYAKKAFEFGHDVKPVKYTSTTSLGPSKIYTTKK